MEWKAEIGKGLRSLSSRSLQPRVSQSWVSVDGVSDWEGKQQLQVHWKDVFMSDVEPPLGTLRFEGP